ncbi:MAG: IS66 family transposase [Gammaproteobacteria bacterium]
MNGTAAEVRYHVRQQKAKPLLDQIRLWLDAALPEIPPTSAPDKALYYLHHQWARLVRYLEDGRLSIDNNRIENAIRPFVLGRKNWLFCDTVRGAKASANLYSLIETALCRIRHSAVHAELRTMPKCSSKRSIITSLWVTGSA